MTTVASTSEKRLWEVDHPYYCTEGNYFRSHDSDIRTIWSFGSWDEFMAEMKDADPDYNLLFRWDWQEGGDHDLPNYNGDDYYRNGRLLLFYMHQRKGYHSTSIVEVCRADEPAIREWLTPKLDYLLRLWEPLTRAAIQKATNKEQA